MAAPAENAETLHLSYAKLRVTSWLPLCRKIE